MQAHPAERGLEPDYPTVGSGSKGGTSCLRPKRKGSHMCSDSRRRTAAVAAGTARGQPAVRAPHHAGGGHLRGAAGGGYRADTYGATHFELGDAALLASASRPVYPGGFRATIFPAVGEPRASSQRLRQQRVSSRASSTRFANSSLRGASTNGQSPRSSGDIPHGSQGRTDALCGH